MKKKIIIVIAAVVAVGVLFLCGIGLSKKDKTPNVNSQSIETIMTDNTTIEISNVRDTGDDSFIADVEITMPDILAIYKHLYSTGKADEMTLAEICSTIFQYASDTDYLTQHNITASVRKEGSKWELTSTDCVDELVRKMMNNLFTQVINNIGSFDIKAEEDFLWEDAQ